MSPAPHRPKTVTADAAHHQMSPQIKGSKKSQEHNEDCGEV